MRLKIGSLLGFFVLVMMIASIVIASIVILSNLHIIVIPSSVNQH